MAVGGFAPTACLYRIVAKIEQGRATGWPSQVAAAGGRTLSLPHQGHLHSNIAYLLPWEGACSVASHMICLAGRLRRSIAHVWRGKTTQVHASIAPLGARHQVQNACKYRML